MCNTSSKLVCVTLAREWEGERVHVSSNLTAVLIKVKEG